MLKSIESKIQVYLDKTEKDLSNIKERIIEYQQFQELNYSELLQNTPNTLNDNNNNKATNNKNTHTNTTLLNNMIPPKFNTITPNKTSKYNYNINNNSYITSNISNTSTNNSSILLNELLLNNTKERNNLLDLIEDLLKSNQVISLKYESERSNIILPELDDIDFISEINKLSLNIKEICKSTKKASDYLKTNFNNSISNIAEISNILKTKISVFYDNSYKLYHMKDGNKYNNTNNSLLNDNFDEHHQALNKLNQLASAIKDNTTASKSSVSQYQTTFEEFYFSCKEAFKKLKNIKDKHNKGSVDKRNRINSLLQKLSNMEEKENIDRNNKSNLTSKIPKTTKTSISDNNYISIHADYARETNIDDLIMPSNNNTNNNIISISHSNSKFNASSTLVKSKSINNIKTNRISNTISNSIHSTLNNNIIYNDDNKSTINNSERRPSQTTSTVLNAYKKELTLEEKLKQRLQRSVSPRYNHVITNNKNMSNINTTSTPLSNIKLAKKINTHNNSSVTNNNNNNYNNSNSEVSVHKNTFKNNINFFNSSSRNKNDVNDSNTNNSNFNSIINTKSFISVLDSNNNNKISNKIIVVNTKENQDFKDMSSISNVGSHYSGVTGISKVSKLKEDGSSNYSVPERKEDINNNKSNEINISKYNTKTTTHTTSNTNNRIIMLNNSINNNKSKGNILSNTTKNSNYVNYNKLITKTLTIIKQETTFSILNTNSNTNNTTDETNEEIKKYIKENTLIKEKGKQLTTNYNILKTKYDELKVIKKELEENLQKTKISNTSEMNAFMNLKNRRIDELTNENKMLSLEIEEIKVNNKKIQQDSIVNYNKASIILNEQTSLLFSLNTNSIDILSNKIKKVNSLNAITTRQDSCFNYPSIYSSISVNDLKHKINDQENIINKLNSQINIKSLELNNKESLIKEINKELKTEKMRIEKNIQENLLLKDLLNDMNLENKRLKEEFVSKKLVFEEEKKILSQNINLMTKEKEELIENIRILRIEREEEEEAKKIIYQNRWKDLIQETLVPASFSLLNYNGSNDAKDKLIIEKKNTYKETLNLSNDDLISNNEKNHNVIKLVDSCNFNNSLSKNNNNLEINLVNYTFKHDEDLDYSHSSINKTLENYDNNDIIDIKDSRKYETSIERFSIYNDNGKAKTFINENLLMSNCKENSISFSDNRNNIVNENIKIQEMLRKKEVFINKMLLNYKYSDENTENNENIDNNTKSAYKYNEYEETINKLNEELEIIKNIVIIKNSNIYDMDENINKFCILKKVFLQFNKNLLRLKQILIYRINFIKTHKDKNNNDNEYYDIIYDKYNELLLDVNTSTTLIMNSDFDSIKAIEEIISAFKTNLISIGSNEFIKDVYKYNCNNETKGISIIQNSKKLQATNKSLLLADSYSVKMMIFYTSILKTFLYELNLYEKDYYKNKTLVLEEFIKKKSNINTNMNSNMNNNLSIIQDNSVVSFFDDDMESIFSPKNVRKLENNDAIDNKNTNLDDRNKALKKIINEESDKADEGNIFRVLNSQRKSDIKYNTNANSNVNNNKDIRISRNKAEIIDIGTDTKEIREDKEVRSDNIMMELSNSNLNYILEEKKKTIYNDENDIKNNNEDNLIAENSFQDNSNILHENYKKFNTINTDNTMNTKNENNINNNYNKYSATTLPHLNHNKALMTIQNSSNNNINKNNSRNIKTNNLNTLTNSLVRHSKDTNKLATNKTQSIINTFNNNNNKDLISNNTSLTNNNNINNSSNLNTALIHKNKPTTSLVVAQTDYELYIKQTHEDQEQQQMILEQLKNIKEELKQTRIEKESYKQKYEKSITLQGGNNDEIVSMLNSAFLRLLEEIVISNKIKELVIVVLKILNYNSDEIDCIINKKSGKMKKERSVSQLMKFFKKKE